LNTTSDFSRCKTPERYTAGITLERDMSPASGTKSTGAKKNSINCLKQQSAMNDVEPQEKEMDEDEEKELASIIKEQINLDRETEKAKNELATQPDFNLVDIFRLFDIETKGFIDKYELEDGLSLFQIFPSEKELYLLMKRFDKDGDGRIRCSDFCRMLMPIQDGYAEMLKDRMAYAAGAKQLPETLSIDTTFLLRRTLQTIISNESYCECLRHRLHAKKSFSLYKAFKRIDTYKNGFLSLEDFKNLLKVNGFAVSKKDLISLMSRFDRNRDARVSYNEFVEEMKPKADGKC